MQMIQHNQTSQSEALENLVVSFPVKERQKLLRAEQNLVNSTKKRNTFQNLKLDLEIATYWLLSKYSQTRKRQSHHLGSSLK